MSLSVYNCSLSTFSSFHFSSFSVDFSSQLLSLFKSRLAIFICVQEPPLHTVQPNNSQQMGQVLQLLPGSSLGSRASYIARRLYLCVASTFSNSMLHWNGCEAVGDTQRLALTDQRRAFFWHASAISSILWNSSSAVTPVS